MGSGGTYLPCRRLRSFFSKIQSRDFFADFPLAFLNLVLQENQERRLTGARCGVWTELVTHLPQVSGSPSLLQPALDGFRVPHSP